MGPVLNIHYKIRINTTEHWLGMHQRSRVVTLAEALLFDAWVAGIGFFSYLLCLQENMVALRFHCKGLLQWLPTLHSFQNRWWDWWVRETSLQQGGGGSVAAQTLDCSVKEMHLFLGRWSRRQHGVNIQLVGVVVELCVGGYAVLELLLCFAETQQKNKTLPMCTRQNPIGDAPWALVCVCRSPQYIFQLEVYWFLDTFWKTQQQWSVTTTHKVVLLSSTYCVHTMRKKSKNGAAALACQTCKHLEDISSQYLFTYFC